MYLPGTCGKCSQRNSGNSLLPCVYIREWLSENEVLLAFLAEVCYFSLTLELERVAFSRSFKEKYFYLTIIIN
jgi:hypothetical protein